MLNEESHPTPSVGHIEIQHYAIQEWHKAGDIVKNKLITPVVI